MCTTVRKEDMQLFNSVHHALVFAFNYSSYPESEIGRLQGPMAGSDKGLTGMDGATQAGFIRGEVDRLNRLHKACIIARYSPKFKECPCCKNASVPLSDYKEAITVLNEWSITVIGKLSSKKMRDVYIRAFYEPEVSLKREAETLNVPKSTAYEQRDSVFRALMKLEETAMDEISTKLHKMLAPE